MEMEVNDALWAHVAWEGLYVSSTRSDLHLCSPQPDTSLCFKTTDTGLTYNMVCLFAPSFCWC